MRYVALLRAINVGGHVVKMDALRSAFEALRFTGVETFIASGNVVFETASTAGASELEANIEAWLAQRLGYSVATFLRTPRQLATVVASRPFGAGDPQGSGHVLSVGFVKAPPSAVAAASLIAFASDVDEFRIIDREIYWRCRGRTSDSKFSGARMEKMLGAPATFRNITTVRKLAMKYAP